MFLRELPITSAVLIGNPLRARRRGGQVSRHSRAARCTRGKVLWIHAVRNGTTTVFNVLALGSLCADGRLQRDIILVGTSGSAEITRQNARSRHRSAIRLYPGHLWERPQHPL